MNLLSKIFPSDSLQSVCVCVPSGIIRIVRPPDLSIDQVQDLFGEAAYEFRTGSIGYAGIAAACMWTTWAVPSGSVLLPFFATISALKSLEKHIVANGAEKIEFAFKSGNIEFDL